MPYLNDRVLDLGLNVLDTEADKITVCNAEPATFTAANATNALGSKSFSVGAAFGSPAARAGGRKVATTAISDGVIATTGSASHWAGIDTVNSRLLVAQALTASQPVTAGNVFTLAAMDVSLLGPA
ncbi:hypothetical protein OSH10_08300 [Kaistia defluvii]|uniref:hypothetical protein n=1 Tax=Kaistia defluvii TaxID=410841 RepID=UPI00225794FD|nr:hypothetical protein [Kaistia defluvii]MCX5518434.1 hypothetical protein [Kaistia defluvii]